MEEILEYASKFCIENELLIKSNINLLQADEIKTLKELKGDWKLELKLSIEYDILYDKLYIGPYYEVPEYYKRMFLVLSFLKAITAFASQNASKFVDFIKILDVALMIGSGLKEASLITEFTQKAHDYVVKLQPFTTIKLIPESELVTTESLCDVDSIKQPSIEHFMTRYFYLHKPVRITDAIDQWPALEKWKDVNYLINLIGYRTVPIEIGRAYDDDNWGQNLYQFYDFIKQYMNSECSQKGYLAQHDLFEQIPILKEDFFAPDYCAIGDDDPIIKSWIGPKNTISTMHTDDKHNILCQVVGEKFIILASPNESENLYPYDGLLNNTSQIDAENIDFTKFPKAKNVQFQRLILKAGQILFIPKLHWHYVRSLTPSISISFWFDCNS